MISNLQGIKIKGGIFKKETNLVIFKDNCRASIIYGRNRAG